MAYVTKAEREYEAAYKEGYVAFDEGVGTMECPYRGIKREGWLAGWNRARFLNDLGREFW